MDLVFPVLAHAAGIPSALPVRFRQRGRVLRYGSTAVLASEAGLAAYARFTADEAVVVAVNTGEAREVSLPVWIAGATDGQEFERLMMTDEAGYNVGHVRQAVTNGALDFRMERCSSVIWNLRK